MATDLVSGTEGYAQEAPLMLVRYEGIASTQEHAAVLHLLPPAPARVIDIGAGTGRDSGWFAAMGHSVVAVEPTAELRLPGVALHPSPLIEWIDDSLPDLAIVMARGETFDLVMLTAVFMHLDEDQRRRAMPNLARLLAPGGVMILKFRHGPVPPTRRMFEVSDEEMIDLAQAEGLRQVLNATTPSIQENNRLAGVTWSQFAFMRP